LKEVLTKRRKLTGYDVFLLGAIAKTVATVVTFPYLVVKSRLQMKSDYKYLGTMDVLGKIWRNQGIQGFYNGISSKIVQSVLNAAFLFAFQDELVKVFATLIKSLSSPKTQKLQIAK